MNADLATADTNAALAAVSRGGAAPGPQHESRVPETDAARSAAAADDPFTSLAESALCERVLGDRRHGLDL